MEILRACRSLVAAWRPEETAAAAAVEAIDEGRQATDRQVDPDGSVGRLITDFVSGLFQQEEIEQCLLGLGIRPRVQGVVRDFAISAEERRFRVFAEALHQCRALRLRCGERLHAAFALRIAGCADCVVDGAQQPCDIAQRAAFLTPLFHGLGRFAFEVHDVGIALDHEDLAEMEVAMHARTQSADTLGGVLANCGEQSLALIQDMTCDFLRLRVDRHLGHCALRLLQDVEREVELHLCGCAPIGRVVGSCRYRRESRIGRWQRQAYMQFRQPSADNCGEAGVGAQLVLVVVICGHLRRQLARCCSRGRCFIGGAAQVVQGPAPAVALVADVALQHRKGVGRAIGCDAHDFTEQAGDIAKAQLREVTRHLCFGMNARHDAADDLQHAHTADDQRTVRLLGAQPRDLGIGGYDKRVVGAFGDEVDFSADARRQYAAFAQCLEHGMHERRQRECIGQEADAIGAPQSREGELLRQGGQGFLVPQHADGQHVAIGARFAVLVATDVATFYLDFGQEQVGRRQGCDIAYMRMAYRHAFAGEPAATRQVVRQHFALQYVA